jgi:MscS family membrane protein
VGGSQTAGLRKILLLVVATVVVIAASAQLETLPELAAKLPDFFHRSFLRIDTWQWCGLAFILLICVIGGSVVRSLFKRFTYLRDRFAAQGMSDGTRATVSRAAGLLGATMLAYGLIPDLELRGRIEFDLTTMVRATALFAAVLMLYGWWDAVCDSIAAHAAGHRRAERLLIPITRKLVRAIIVITGILIALAAFYGEKTITGLVAGLGVGGVVLALAAKDSVENVFASVTILFDMPFALGDWIKMDKVEGEVEEINLRSTRIRTINDTVITLPNANLIRNPVENFGARRLRRQRLSIRLGYESDPQAIDRYCEGLREFLDAQPNVQGPKTMVELDEPTETSLGITVIWYLEVESVQEEATSRHALLDEALRLKKSTGVIFAGPAAPV